MAQTLAERFSSRATQPPATTLSDRFASRAAPVKAPAVTKLSPPEEKQFQSWYKGWATKAGIDPDPDNPAHKYNYRAAFKAGVEPTIDPSDNLHHWPSEFKAPDHPNRFVNGVDTITGKPVTSKPAPLPASVSLYERTGVGPVIGAVADAISPETGVAFAPLRGAQGAIEKQATEYESEFSPEDPLYPIAAGLSEARRRALKISSDILLDPTNLLPLGTLMKGARWGVRLAADALFVGLAETGAIQAVKEGRYDDAAVQQAMALVGIGAAAKGKKNLVLQETKRRLRTEETIRSEAAVAKDIASYEAKNKAVAAGKAEAATRPNQAQRRATIEVPETTTPEDPTLRFSEAELEALTAPPKPLETNIPAQPPVKAATLPVVSPLRERFADRGPAPVEVRAAEVSTAVEVLPTETKVGTLDSPEVLPRADREPGLSDRWHIDRDLAQDAHYWMDGVDGESANAAIIKDHDRFSVEFKDGGFSGSYATLQEAVSAAEKRVPQVGVGETTRRISAPKAQIPETIDVVPETKPPKPSTVATLYADIGEIRQHKGHTDKKADAATLREYADRIEEAAIAHDVPIASTAIDKAIKGLRDGDMTMFTAAAENARLALRAEYGKRLAASEAKKAGIELPKTDAPALELTAEPAKPVTQFDRIVDDAVTFEKGESQPLLGATTAEAATLAGAGRRPELLKEGKTFDQSRLVESELFQGQGGPQQFLGTDKRAEAGVTKSVDADISFDFGASAIERLDTSIKASNTEISDLFKSIAKGETLGANLPIQLTAALVKNGALRIAKGTVEFTAWSAEMITDFGERVRPYLRDVHNQAVARARIARDSKVQGGPRLEAILESGEDPVGKLMAGIKSAGKNRTVLENAYRDERAKRAEALDRIFEEGKGRKGFDESLGALYGEMAADKKNMEVLGVTEFEADVLFNEIQGHVKLKAFEKVTTQDGLRQLLRGRIPKRSQLELLKEVFGADLVQAVNRNRGAMSRLGQFLIDRSNDARTLIAGVGDISAIGRQGAMLEIRNPKVAAKAIPNSIADAFSQKRYDAWLEAQPSHPMHELREESGLFIADQRSEKVGARDERFPKSVVEKVPVIGHLIRFSSRHYTSLLNRLGTGVFDNLAEQEIRKGVDPKKNPEVFKDYARMVNEFRGRGHLGVLEPVAEHLAVGLFAPRLVASRLHMLSPRWYSKLSKPARIEAVKTMATFIGTGAAVLTLAKAGGSEVELDPRSTEFGKIKVGNTRFDIWGGLQQYVRAFSQVAAGYRKNAKGDLVKLSADEFPYDSRLNVAGRFGMSKLAPGASFITDMLRGQGLFGEKLTLQGEAFDNTIALYIQDINEAVQEHGLVSPITAAVGAGSFIGLGTQTYRERPPQGAIHSQVFDSLSDASADAIMKSAVNVGAIARKKDKNGKDAETAAEYALRKELVGLMIDERVALIVNDPRHASRSEEQKKGRIEAAIKKGRDMAKPITAARTASRIAELRQRQEKRH